MLYFFYKPLWLLLLPFAVVRLYWRSRKEPGYRHHIIERFAVYPARLSPPAFWLHAVSVGEVRASEPLVRKILASWPELSLVLTVMTPGGRETAEALFKTLGERLQICYLPYDFAPLVRRFLTHFEPVGGVIMETELWPTLLHISHQRGIALALVNARLSERSAAGYARFSQTSAGMLRTLNVICAQSESDAERFRALGASKVHITGNIKYDLDISPAQTMLAEQFRAALGERRVVLMASSREGEEALMLAAWQATRQANELLMIVPRHARRFDDVAELVRDAGLSLQRRSDGAAEKIAAVAGTTDVWLGDSMGEMQAYYRSADIAIIGGSWLPFGSQNLIEACAVGCPVLIGPHTFNFAEASELALSAGAARRCIDLQQASHRAIDMSNTEQQKMREAALAFGSRHRGACERILSVLVADRFLRQALSAAAVKLS